MVLCPMPQHDNVRTFSKASSYHGQEKYIKCHGAACGVTMSLPGRKVDPEYLKLLSPGKRVEDFKPVSTERRKDMETVFAIGGVFPKYDRTAHAYVAARGLDPERHIGRFGFVPPAFSNPLANFVGSESFKRVRKETGSSDVHLDNIIAFAKAKGFDIEEVSQSAIRNLFAYLENLEAYDRDLILSNLTIGSLSRLLGRAVIGRNNENQERFGGRLQLPTYLLKEAKEGDSLSLSNFNARGITVDGVNIYEGHQNLKARLSKTRKKAGGMILRSTPTGAWIKDPEMFRLSVG